MRTVFVLLFLFHVASAVNHSLKFFITASYGVEEFPEFVTVATVDGVQIGHCDSEINKVKPKQDWIKEMIKEDPQHLRWFSEECQALQGNFKNYINITMHHLNQSGGLHILQEMCGCEWNNETGETVGFDQYGYDGEDYISLDLKNMRWIALTSMATMITYSWNTDYSRLQYNEDLYMNKCPEWLQKYLLHGKNFFQRRVLPSVSLLQKSHSSPVSCFATGFYPDRAVMFWRKDGEELYEGVDHREILPNNDDTFQMSADLNISLVKLEDWERYECVFQLSGVKEDIVTRLEKLKINGSTSGFPVALVVAGVSSCLLLLFLCIFGLWKWKNNNSDFQPANREQHTTEEGTVLK